MPDAPLCPTLFVDSDFTLYELAAWDADALKELFEAMGVHSLPASGQSVTEGDRTAIRLTPRLGLLLSGPGTSPPHLKHAGGCVVDLTHGRSRITLEGPGSRRRVSGLIAIDAERFPAGSSCVAPVHGVPITLLCRSQDRFELLVPRSFLRSLQAWIQDTDIAA